MKFEKKSTLIIGGIAGVCVIGAAVTGFALNSGRNNVNPDKDAINVLAQETTANISKNEIINSSTNASETATNISEQSSEELESTSEEVIEEEVIEETIEETNNSENYEEPQTEKTVVEENNNNNYYSDNEESENDNDTSEDNDYSEPENNYDDNNYSDNSSDYEEPETEAKTEEVSQRNIIYKADGSIDLANSVFCGGSDRDLICNSNEMESLVSKFMNENPGKRVRYDINGGNLDKGFTVYDLYYSIRVDGENDTRRSFKFNGVEFVFK